MGTMSYAGLAVEFDDRVLTHLQVAIVLKFRRGEAFPMSWVDSPAIGSGRSALWLTPAVPIVFTFDEPRVPAVDRAWIDRLLRAAEGPRGLVVVDAEGDLVRALGTGHRPVASHRAP